MMEGDIATELRALLRVIFDLRAPGEGEADLQISRPESLRFFESGWLEDLVRAIVEGVLTTFDLRRKTKTDDAKEIEEWKNPAVADGWVERRKNHRLRIRTMVDDLFEKNRPLPDVLSCVRAWKLQVADKCADVILERFHVRPASSGPWASCRKTMRDIGENLRQALAHKDLFSMTGRIAEAKAMEPTIKSAYQAIRELMQDIEEHDSPGHETRTGGG